MNPTYEIKITGSGTRDELIKALKKVIDSIDSEPIHLDGIEWEDETLFTEFKCIED